MFDDRAQILLPPWSDLPSATRRYKARIPNEARHTVSGSIKSVAATGWPKLNSMWLVPVLLVFIVSRTDAAADVGIVRMSDLWAFLSSFDCQSKQRIQLPLCSITSQTGHFKGFITSAQACINAQAHGGSICTVFCGCCLSAWQWEVDPMQELMGENTRLVGAAAVKLWLYTKGCNLWNTGLQRVQKTSSTLHEADLDLSSARELELSFWDFYIKPTGALWQVRVCHKGAVIRWCRCIRGGQTDGDGIKKEGPNGSSEPDIGITMTK